MRNVYFLLSYICPNNNNNHYYYYYLSMMIDEILNNQLKKYKLKNPYILNVPYIYIFSILGYMATGCEY